MTSSTSMRVPAPTGGHSALRRLVSVPVDEFADRYWGREPLLSPADTLPAGFADLFSNTAVDELVSRRGLRAPFLRVAKNGTTLADRAFTDGGGVGAAIADQASDDKLLALFADGATIVLQGLHRTWEPMLSFSQDLAADLGHPVQVNAYVTPAQNTGFSDHYDVHDVFVLQIAGEKRWRIRPPVHPSPLRDEPWTDRRDAVEAAAHADPLIESTLRPGDCLYLPRGYLHSATALGDVSTHLTIGVHPWTRRHLGDELVAAAVRRANSDESVRASLPLGVDLNEPGDWDTDLEVVRDALVRALQSTSAADLAAALPDRSRRAQRAAPIAPVAQVRAAARLTEQDEVTLRSHLGARLVPTPEGGTVRSRATDVSVVEADVPAVQRLLEDGRASVADLGPDLSRRLLFAAVVVAAPHPR
ncbi:MAG: cupin domain-containing protein [Actinomycetota bacterium]|nr:cupin domain-containing protein [Actinomycetota bacterium]